MIKDYLNEILDEKKTFDARSYPTNKRGTIVLIDSRLMKAYGTIELIECREITPQEYVSWHCTGRWSGCTMHVDSSKKYYAWDFKNPRKLAKPIKLNCEKHTWIELAKDIELYYQESLL